jgi:hypothetical protein
LHISIPSKEIWSGNVEAASATSGASLRLL